MRRGFLLIELLFTIGLIAVFAAVAFPVARWSIRALTDPSPTAAARLDNAVDALRHDVWQATTLAAPSPHELALAGPGGRSVTWHVGPGGVMRRMERPPSAPAGRSPNDSPARPAKWPGVFPDATVAVDGTAVRLTIPDARGYRGGVIVLPGQAALLAGGTP